MTCKLKEKVVKIFFFKTFCNNFKLYMKNISKNGVKKISLNCRTLCAIRVKYEYAFTSPLS